jgi:hypothetical protein
MVPALRSRGSGRTVHDVAPQLAAPLDKYQFLGEFQVSDDAGVGEVSLDHMFAVKAGQWRAWLLAGPDLDDLVDDGQVPEEASEQLLLVHVDSRPVPLNELPPLTHVTEVPIEAASFTFACATLSAALVDDDGFYEHLDGVHGVLKSGRGVHIQLDGDGRAVVWTSAASDCVLVELQ